MTANFHTHTARCRHAQGDVRDYVEQAVKQGLTVLGFSDHTPLPDNRWENVRMRMAELGGYLEAIKKAQTDFTGIKLYSGLEYALEYVNFYREALLGEYGLDYLAGGAHWFPFHGGWLDASSELDSPRRLIAYVRLIVKSMESGLFAFIAHPDLYMRAHRTWDHNAIAAAREIFVAAEALAVPLEINCYGFRKKKIETDEGLRPPYPFRPFWELASQYRVSVVVNSDAHSPHDVADLRQGLDLAGECGLFPISLEGKV